jgi:hypothetical protein
LQKHVKCHMHSAKEEKYLRSLRASLKGKCKTLQNSYICIVSDMHGVQPENREISL